MQFKYINIKNISISFFALITIMSCSDILDEEPVVQLSTEQYYQTETDALGALTGAYAQLKDGVGYYRQQLLSNLHAASDQGVSN